MLEWQSSPNTTPTVLGLVLVVKETVACISKDQFDLTDFLDVTRLTFNLSRTFKCDR
jgi:hypothetical protein